MKFLAVRSLPRSRFALSIGAGLLLAVAFPLPGIAGFAWIAPGLMLASAVGTRGAEAFRIGYVAGLTFYLGALRWLLHIPVTGFPILGWAALSAFLALYPATWVWLCLKILNPRSDSVSEPGLNPWEASVLSLSRAGWSRRLVWSLTCAAIWVALEMTVTRLFGGFPWLLLGITQHRIAPLIQFASFTGIYGVSFLVTWGSVSLLCAGVMIVRRPQMSSAWMTEVFLPFGAVMALFVFGFHRLAHPPAAGRELRVTMVQPSIPQTLIWNPENNEERFRQLVRLSEIALTNQTDVLLWPESAIPKLLRYDRETFEAVTNLAARHHVWMIVGSDDAEPSKTSRDPKAADYFNSSFLISPFGELAGRYRKRSLVIFGEYIPLTRWLPFLKWFTPVQDSFAAGDRPVQFELPDLAAQTSVLICFEDIFPQLGRDSTGPGTDFLVNLTNDGWFGESCAQWQHAAAAGFRAIEEGIPLLRCTNNGLTCWFDSQGRMRAFFQASNTGIYGAGVLTVSVPLPPPGQKHELTFYHQYGDWMGWGCVGITILGIAGLKFAKGFWL